MKKKIPDKYKYLFENPKPLSECTKEEKAVYAYFDHISQKGERWIEPLIATLAILGIVVAVVTICFLVVGLYKLNTGELGTASTIALIKPGSALI